MNDAILTHLLAFCKNVVEDLPDHVGPAPEFLWLDPLVQNCFEHAAIALEAEWPEEYAKMNRDFERVLEALADTDPDPASWGENGYRNLRPHQPMLS